MDATRENLCLRDLKVPVDYVPKLWEDRFEATAAMFPQFDPASAPEGGGPSVLSVTATIEVTEIPAPQRGTPSQ